MLLVFGITNTKWVQCNHSFGCTGTDLFYVQKQNFGVNWLAFGNLSDGSILQGDEDDDETDSDGSEEDSGSELNAVEPTYATINKRR